MKLNGSDRDGERGADGQIVIVRPQVVESVGHVLGNLFQRIYHFINQTAESDAIAAAQLETNTRQLEQFLQLVIDYFSPLSLVLQQVPSTDVIQSLARQLSETIGGCVKLDAKLPIEGRLLVDPGRLARGFALLATQLTENAVKDESIEVQAVERPAGRSLSLHVCVPRRLVSMRSATAEIQWAVAEKCVEVHGGALHESRMPSGDVLWQIVLPLQP